jgi:hypothetical protein
MIDIFYDQPVRMPDLKCVRCGRYHGRTLPPTPCTAYSPIGTSHFCCGTGSHDGYSPRLIPVVLQGRNALAMKGYMQRQS